MTIIEAIAAIEKKWDEKDYDIYISISKRNNVVKVQYSGHAGGRSCPPYDYNSTTGVQKENNWTLEQIVEHLTRDIDTTKDPAILKLAAQLASTPEKPHAKD